MGYDKNGNIQNLIRKGGYEADNPQGDIAIDELDYDYDGNQLKKVVDSSNSDEGFKDGSNTGDDYTYDRFGNMIVDQNKNITQITYNHLNLPTKVTFQSGAYITYTYDAAGVKQRKKLVDGNEVSITDYLGGFQYRAERKENSRWLFLANEPGGVWAELQFFPHAEGYVSHVLDANDNPVYKYIYQYKDHLGNVRMNYSDENNNGVIDSNERLEENHYYPPDNIRDGLEHTYYDPGKKEYKRVQEGGGNDWQIKLEEVSNSGYQYKYNGKEMQDELGLNVYDYGARFYDPAVPHFWQIDSKAEEFPSQSPYVYAANNPVFFIDKDGMAPETMFVDEQGNTIADIDDGSDAVFVITKDNESNVISALQEYDDNNQKPTAEENAKLGEENGFNLKDIESIVVTHRGHDKNSDWGNKYEVGFREVFDENANFLDKLWNIFSMGTGKGGSSYYYGKCDGSEVKDKGNLNPFNPELKGNSPENTFDFTQPATISNQTYTIQRGDNLSGIAKSHNTTVSNLAKTNNISNIDKIYPGTILNIK